MKFLYFSDAFEIEIEPNQAAAKPHDLSVKSESLIFYRQCACYKLCVILPYFVNVRARGQLSPKPWQHYQREEAGGHYGGRRGASNNGILVDLDHLWDLSTQ